jgi:two-component sensor histidine kinase
MTEEAERYYDESRRIKKKTGERLEEAIALNNLGKLKLQLKDLKQAEYYITSAEKLVRETDALDELRENLELQVSLYVAKKDYPMALRSAEELMTVKDSLLNKEKAESLHMMQTRYETEKKEEQITSLQKEQELRRREILTKRIWIWGLAIIITLMAAIGVLLYLGYRQSQRNKNRVETLLKELHHRVKNNLQILSSIINLQSQGIKDENALLAIRSNESRVNTMALIHKKLYRPDGNNAIDMKEYTEELVQFLIQTYGFEKNTIDFVLKSESIYLDVDVAIPVGLIINEVVSNALKYAYIGHKNPMLEIHLQILEKHDLAVIVSDNGPGITDAVRSESSRSFGLRMVQTLTKELKGKLNIETHGGTTFNLHIPIA